MLALTASPSYPRTLISGDRGYVEGFPPKVIWLDAGSAATAAIAALLRRERERRGDSTSSSVPSFFPGRPRFGNVSRADGAHQFQRAVGLMGQKIVGNALEIVGGFLLQRNCI